MTSSRPCLSPLDLASWSGVDHAAEPVWCKQVMVRGSLAARGAGVVTWAAEGMAGAGGEGVTQHESQ